MVTEVANVAAGRTRRCHDAAARTVRLLVALLLVTACSAPDEPMPHSVFFGLDVPNSRTAQTMTLAKAVGAEPTVVSLFVKYDSTFTTTSLHRLAKPGVTPFITLEPWLTGMRAPAADEPDFTLASIVDGVHDPALRLIAHKIADFGRPVYLRFAHEMNGNWYPWAARVNGNRPADYPAAWRHVHALFAPITGDRARWVFSPAAIDAVGSSPPSLADLYPGDDVVDYIGMTGYNHDWATATQTIAPTLTELSALTAKPIILSEIGSDGPRKSQWIASLPTLFRAQPRIKGFVYYSTSPETTGATGDYRIDSDPQTTAAFRQLVRTIAVS